MPIVENQMVESKPEGAHTPGPWYARDTDDETVWIEPQGRGNENVICDIVGRISTGAGTKATDEDFANAHLIAASPDLLAACEEFIRKCENGEAKSVRSYAQMKAAVAKARGGNE